MNNDRDPLDTLRFTKDPDEAEWAMRALYDAGFRDVAGIARDCGWLIVRHSEVARYIHAEDA